MPEAFIAPVVVSAVLVVVSVLWAELTAERIWRRGSAAKPAARHPEVPATPLRRAA